jgi:hypothetical protein
MNSGGVFRSFVLKLNSSGVEQWADSLSEFGPSVALDSSNNVYITTQNRRVAKFNSAGALQYDITASNIHGRDIAVDSQGNIFVATQYWPSFTSAEGTINVINNSYDTALVKYPSTCNASACTALWARRVASSGFEDSTGVAVDSTDHAVFTGSFEGTAAVDVDNSHTQNVISAGGKDMFIAR